MTEEAEVFFKSSFRGLQGSPLREDLMKTDTDQERQRIRRATVQTPESGTQRL